MRRVLVPLDGSAFAESIIPDARRLAGPDGVLILVRDASRPTYNPDLGVASGPLTISESEAYLDTIARLLREQGVRVQVRTTFLNDIPVAIDEAAAMFCADMVACATHGRTAVGRLVRGGAAWRAVAESKVPVLLRHPEASSEAGGAVALSLQRRHIMVPLDGSVYAEKALPLAQELAREWHADLLLVRVVPGLPGPEAPYGHVAAHPIHYESELMAARDYVGMVARTLTCEARTYTCTGGVVGRLTEIVDREKVTDIVMASHGRTGLSRMILGSVADSLIHRLHLPIVIIPALVTAEESVGKAIAETVHG